MPLRLETCAADDIDDVMAFIRDHWSPDHVLARHRHVMDWYYRDENRSYNFMLARSDAGEILGILSYIPAKRYDRTLANSADTLWLTTWMVRPDALQGLGLALLRTVEKAHPSHWIGTVGLNPPTRNIYDALGYETGILDRYFLINPNCVQYRLAVLPAEMKKSRPLSNLAGLTPLPEGNFLSATASLRLDRSDHATKKTPTLLFNRYLRNPFYRYRAWLLSNSSDHAVLITRTCIHDGAAALRAIDFIGNPQVLASAGAAFQQLLDIHNAEYMDFYNTGLGQELSAAGLQDIRDENGLILPGHFEPFVSCNVDLYYCIKGPRERLVICKGDADQDRINALGD